MEEAKKIIENLSIEELFVLGKDLWEYKIGDGDVNKESALYRLFMDNLEVFKSFDRLRDVLNNKVGDIFAPIAKLIGTTQPWRIIQYK